MSAPVPGSVPGSVPGDAAPAGGRPAPEGAPASDEPVVTVREARIEDLEAIVDLLADDPVGARTEGGDLAPYAAAFARMTADHGQIQAVAQLSGQIVGTMQLSIIPSLTRRDTTRAQIEGVHTLSSLRGRGIGEALFAWAFDEARRRGATLVQLTSESDRTNAHRFYEHLGFVSGLTGFEKRLGR